MRVEGEEGENFECREVGVITKIESFFSFSWDAKNVWKTAQYFDKKEATKNIIVDQIYKVFV